MIPPCTLSHKRGEEFQQFSFDTPAETKEPGLQPKTWGFRILG